MRASRQFSVRWILLLRDQTCSGLYGTTTHEAATPASAALASAEAVLQSVCSDSTPQELHVLAVCDEPAAVNLLSQDDLSRAERMHPRQLPCPIAYRPLC